jgi:hypothetical protein
MASRSEFQCAGRADCSHVSASTFAASCSRPTITTCVLRAYTPFFVLFRIVEKMLCVVLSQVASWRGLGTGRPQVQRPPLLQTTTLADQHSLFVACPSPPRIGSASTIARNRSALQRCRCRGGQMCSDHGWRGRCAASRQSTTTASHSVRLSLCLQSCFVPLQCPFDLPDVMLTEPAGSGMRSGLRASEPGAKAWFGAVSPHQGYSNRRWRQRPAWLDALRAHLAVKQPRVGNSSLSCPQGAALGQIPAANAQLGMGCCKARTPGQSGICATPRSAQPYHDRRHLSACRPSSVISNQTVQSCLWGGRAAGSRARSMGCSLWPTRNKTGRYRCLTMCD